jgi:hypothetical protein
VKLQINVWTLNDDACRILFLRDDFSLKLLFQRGIFKSVRRMNPLNVAEHLSSIDGQQTSEIYEFYAYNTGIFCVMGKLCEG